MFILELRGACVCIDLRVSARLSPLLVSQSVCIAKTPSQASIYNKAGLDIKGEKMKINIFLPNVLANEIIPS